eukprot:PITA_06439
MIMQLDIAKAYDKVNWIYVKKVISAFGFDHNWIRWVMAVVTSSSFSILVNGSPSGIFTPSGGLRQGDPLSPFLFIIMMEGLGKSIKRAKVVGIIKGLQLTKNGQSMNTNNFWTTLCCKVDLVKVILKSIPVFLLSTLPAPKGVLQQFNNIQRDFLWGKEETRKKWALVSWEEICKPKSHGGLGLNDLEILSKVLGAKLWWRWVKEPEAKWAMTWKEKYAISWKRKIL